MTKVAAFIKTGLTLLGNTAASLTAILFVLLMLAMIAGLTVDLRLLHPDAYKEAMLSAGAYESLPGILADQSALTQAKGQGSQPILQYLKPDERVALYRYLFPPAWLRAQAEGLLDHLFAYVNQPDSPADLSISLADVRSRVQSPDMAIYIGAVMRSLPVCTLDQAAALLVRVAGGGGLSGADVCMPPSIDSQTVATLFQGQIAAVIAAGIPDKLPLLSPESVVSKEQLQNLQYARQVLYYSPLLGLGLLLLIVLFAVRSRRSLMRWWGMPLLVTAFIAGAGAISLPALATWYLGQSLAGSPNLSPAMLDLLTRVTANLAANVSGFVAIFAIAFGGVGVVLMLASYILRDPRPKPKPAPETVVEGTRPEKKISPWLITLAVLLPVLVAIAAAVGLVLWLVSKGALVL